MKTNPYRTSQTLTSKPSKGFALSALVLTLTVTVATAQSSYPPASLLAAKWWQWAMETPASQSPLTDQTGQFGALNQPNGTVWFPAGNEGGTTVRTVTIPAGKALFFPIANVFDVEDGTAIPGGTNVFKVANPLQVAEAVVANLIATANNLSCSVDGKALAITTANLERSTPFTFLLPAGNLLGVPAGVYYPAVDSGYYVLLNPLSAGQHTIHFTGGIAAFSFTLDVTYHITIQ